MIWRTGRHTPTKNSEEYPPPGVRSRVKSCWMINSGYYSRIGEKSLPPKYCFFTPRNAPILNFPSEFFIPYIPKAKRNSGIHKNFYWLTPILFFLDALPTLSFCKIQNLLSVALSSGITFLLRAVCFPSPHDADVTARPAKGMFVLEARSWDYCFMLVRFSFLSVLPL